MNKLAERKIDKVVREMGLAENNAFWVAGLKQSSKSFLIFVFIPIKSKYVPLNKWKKLYIKTKEYKLLKEYLEKQKENVDANQD